MKPLWLIAGLVFLGTLTLVYSGCVVQESPTRQKLEQMLGQDANGLPQPALPPSEQGWPSLKMSNVFDMAMLKAVDVQETDSTYVLRIPLANPQDAAGVQVNVTPGRIEVSGQTGSKQEHSSLSSSFMQSFTTSQLVLPEKMTRKVERQGDKDVLIVTIPKDSHASKGGIRPILPNPENSIPPTPSSQVPLELDAGEDLPANDGAHRVI